MIEGVKDIRVRAVYPLELSVKVGALDVTGRAYLTVLKKKLYKTSDGKFILMKV